MNINTGLSKLCFWFCLAVQTPVDLCNIHFLKTEKQPQFRSREQGNLPHTLVAKCAGNRVLLGLFEKLSVYMTCGVPWGGEN